MRYFVKCCYKGTAYQGWQRQPHTNLTIQQQLEDAISIVVRHETSIIGCGRTDTAVHASLYYFHFDTDFTDLGQLIYKVNQIIPHDIYCSAIKAVKDGAHARYDATQRGYTYVMSKETDPFRLETCYTHLKTTDINVTKMNEAASLVLGHHSFEAFCKSNTDVNTKLCTITKSEWIETKTEYIYTVRADRFLRGMIRLVVGMCINVSRDKLSLSQVKSGIDNRERLSLDWSVPGKGLFLDKVEYPENIWL